MDIEIYQFNVNEKLQQNLNLIFDNQITLYNFHWKREMKKEICC